ncbi:MAG: GNAT family N-acetyltransferase [Acidobacteriota bacterium]
MPAYLIRRLTRDDEPFLWEMLYHAVYVPEGHAAFQKDVVNEPEIARYVLGWGRAGDQGFAAVEESTSRAVGAAWIRLFTAANKAYGYVAEDVPELSVALLPEYRNQGIGTSLMNRLIHATGDQYRALSLSVSADNPAARLYKRLGFKVVERVGTSLTMMKDCAT